MVDVDTRRLHSDDGRPVAFAVPLYARDELILCFEVVRFAGTPRQVPYDLTGHEFRFGLKQATQLHVNTKLAFTDVDKINLSGDWDDASLDAGKIAVRVDLNTEGIVALFASASAVIECVAEIEAERDDKATTLVQFAVALRPDVIRLLAPEPGEGQPAYITEPQFIERVHNENGTVQIGTDGVLRIWDRGTETYRRAEFENGALIAVEDEE